MTEKTCTKCGCTKLVTEFTKDSRYSGGVKSWCKPCYRTWSREYARTPQQRIKRAERNRTPEGRKALLESSRKWRERNPERSRQIHRKSSAMRKYGLTLEQYEEIISRGCEVCGVKEGVKLAVDHCHTGKQVRGCLCTRCNTSLGQLHENPARIRALAAYAEKHAEKKTA